MYEKLPDLRRLKTYDRTKDISCHPYFLGGISRWVWRLYMYRVTPAGRWFIGLSLILIVYGTSSIDLQIYVPLLYAFGIWVIAWLWAMFLPPRPNVTVVIPDRVAARSNGSLTLNVHSTARARLTEMFVVPMRLSPYIDITSPIGFKVSDLEPEGTVSIPCEIYCRRRGVYTIKGFRSETSFPLGLLNAYSNHWLNEKLLVYPRFDTLNHIDLPSGPRYQPGGVALASSLGESLEYIGNRDYREGDNIRDIDWRATARLTKPIIREYREEYFHRAGVILDTYVPKSDQDRDADFENAVSISAGVSDYMSRAEYVVDLFAAGPMLYHLTAGRNLAFQDQILDILANIESTVNEPFQIIEPELLDTLSLLTTVVCVFLDWNAVRHAFVDRVREVSAVKVIIVRDSPCTLDPTPYSSELSLQMIDHESFERGVYEL